MARRRLSERQKARIAKIQEDRRQKASERAEQALQSGEGEEHPQHGRVITRHGQSLLVEDESGNIHHCLLRQNIGLAVCGDRVVWQTTTPGQGVVTALLERDTALTRPTFSGEEKPLAANISLLVVVIAPKPEPSPYLVDQYLAAAELIGVDAIIALNKSDLLDEEQHREMDERFGVYAEIGYPFVQISAREAHGLDPLLALLQDRTSILVGQSGVGKSSLIKALLPDIDIQIGRLSERSGLGRHTTSATTFYDLPQGGHLIDSPGVRSFRLGRISRRQLEQGFREFLPFIGGCKFKDCSHSHEPGCALMQAVEEGRIHPRRLNNFRHMADALPSD